MSKSDPTIKIPFIVKGILADNSVKISSVFTSDKEIFSFERLKYLVDTKQIELLNAYIDKDQVVFTNDFNYIKKNKNVVSDILCQKINSYEVLTNTQKELSKIFNDTAFELDIETSNQDSTNNIIYSKSLKITPAATITVRILPCPFVVTHVAEIHFNWTNIIVRIYNATPENLNRLTNLFKNSSSLPVIDSLCAEIIEEYCTNGLCWATIDTSTTVEDIKNICDQFGIYEEYHSFLQNRINITKSHSGLIEQLIRVIKTNYEYDTELLSVESLILYFAFYGFKFKPTHVNESIEREIENIRIPYTENARTQCAIDFLCKAYKYSHVKEILTEYDLYMWSYKDYLIM